MSGLTPPAVPIGILNFAREIDSAWVAAVTTIAEVMEIATVEEVHPQGEENTVRQFKRSELPAVWCSTAPGAVSVPACQMLGLGYTVTWGVLTENADPQLARQEHEDIRQNVVALFSSYEYQAKGDFVSSYTVSFSRDMTMGDAKQDAKSPYRTTSTNEMRLTVFYPSPPVE